MLIKIIAGIFLALHALVHLLYFGHSARLFELQPGLDWPGASWAFSKLLGDNGARAFAGLLCLLAAAGLLIGAVGLLAGQPWWRTAAIAALAVSGALYLLFWNGRLQHLDSQGGIGLLIDGAILAAVLMLRSP